MKKINVKIVLLNNKCHLIPVSSDLSVWTERNYSSSKLNFSPLNKGSVCSINDKIDVHLTSWPLDPVKSHGVPANPDSFQPEGESAADLTWQDGQVLLI